MKTIALLLFMLPFAVSAQSEKDTLIVPASIKVIVIDGVAYDVVRSTELKKSEPKDNILPWNGWDGIRGSGSFLVDTTYWRSNNILLRDKDFFVPNIYKSNKP